MKFADNRIIKFKSYSARFFLVEFTIGGGPLKLVNLPFSENDIVLLAPLLYIVGLEAAFRSIFVIYMYRDHLQAIKIFS
jgi:hypothetical protein